MFQRRNQDGEFAKLMPLLLANPARFSACLRCAPETFYYVLEAIRQAITKHSIRPAIDPEHQLYVFLRFVGHGHSFRSLEFNLRISHQRIASIIYEVSRAIWKNLGHIHIPSMTTERLLAIAGQSNSLWNMPNCVGAIDGKHIRLRAPKKSGSLYYNYKSYFSLVLQGVCDAYHRFTSIEVGGYGSACDSGMFARSRLGQSIRNEVFPFPRPSRLPNSTRVCPYFFIGDNAYPLTRRMMVPYSGRNQGASNQQEQLQRDNFNKRITRARRCIESSFGILVSKFRVFHSELEIETDNVDFLVLASIVLHNIIIDREGTNYSITDRARFEDVGININSGFNISHANRNPTSDGKKNERRANKILLVRRSSHS